MKHLRQYIRTILEAQIQEPGEPSETYKLIRLFLNEDGTMQAIDLAEMLPDINPRVVELFLDIQSRVEEIIEYGRGNFPEEWRKDMLHGIGNPARVLRSSEFFSPFMVSIRELREIAQKEKEWVRPRDDQEWKEIGKFGTIKLGKDFQHAMIAINWVIKEEKTPEEMMAMPKGFGKTFVELAERFGIHI